VAVEMEYSRRISTVDGQSAAPTANMADTRVLDYGSVFLGSPSQTDGDDTSSAPSSASQPGVNVAELLLSRGFAKTSKHRDYEERSHYYDALLAAESRAEKAKKGVHSQKESPVMHITDLTTVSDVSVNLILIFSASSLTYQCGPCMHRYLQRRPKIFFPSCSGTEGIRPSLNMFLVAIGSN
jgi:hypothetical protein